MLVCWGQMNLQLDQLKKKYGNIFNYKKNKNKFKICHFGKPS